MEKQGFIRGISEAWTGIIIGVAGFCLLILYPYNPHTAQIFPKITNLIHSVITGLGIAIAVVSVTRITIRMYKHI